MKIILIVIAVLIMLIPIMQSNILETIVKIIHEIKIGAIFATIIIFFTPSILIGIISPIIIKMKTDYTLTNVISSIDGENSKFIKAEVNTLKQV